MIKRTLILNTSSSLWFKKNKVNQNFILTKKYRILFVDDYQTSNKHRNCTRIYTQT